MADLFVGTVSAALGFVMVLAAALNWERSFEMTKSVWLEKQIGRGGVRVVYAVVGVGLIALGVALTMGYRLFR